MLTAVTNRPYNYRHSVADTATTPQRARFGPSAALDEWNRTSVAIWSRCEDWSSLLYNIWRLLLLNFVFNKLGAILIRRPAGLYTDGTLLAYPRTSRSNAGLFMALSPRKRTTPSRLLGRCFFYRTTCKRSGNLGDFSCWCRRPVVVSKLRTFSRPSQRQLAYFGRNSCSSSSVANVMARHGEHTLACYWQLVVCRIIIIPPSSCRHAASRPHVHATYSRRLFLTLASDDDGCFCHLSPWIIINPLYYFSLLLQHGYVFTELWLV